MQVKIPSRIIINADDFGVNSIVNESISDCFRAGRITSASLLANGEKFNEACEYIRGMGLVKKIGIHLNLSEGLPLEKETFSLNKFCEYGKFNLRYKIYNFINSREKMIIYNEFKAQIKKLIDNSIEPCHIDSHHHVHLFPFIAPIVIKLADEYHIQRIRIPPNFYPSENRIPKTIYAKLFKAVLKKYNISFTNYCSSLKTYYTMFILKNLILKGTLEAKVHVDYSKKIYSQNENDYDFILGEDFTKFIKVFF